jgi:hypothetical protein
MNISFYNTAHLGDCLFQIHYTNKLLEKHENICVNFYCNENYHYQLNEFVIFKDKVKLFSLNNVPSNSIDTWITRDVPGKQQALNKLNEDGFYDLFYVSFFKGLSQLIGVESPINYPRDMLIHNTDLLKENELSGNLDFLFINSVPMSGQFSDYDQNRLDEVIKELKNHGKIITTAPNNCGVPCTLDYGLTLMGIGNLSINSKNIIAINTSPTIACLNIFNIDTFKRFLVLENNIRYSFNNKIKNIKLIKDIIKEFELYISEDL